MTVVDLPALPALVPGRVHHRRHRPFVHDVDAATCLWLVDTTALPNHWPLATFRRRDHLAGDGPSLRAEVLAAAAAAGTDAQIDVSASQRVVMLTGARCLGHTFNPLTVYWGLEGVEVRWALLEIHNTYGGRHVQLLDLDDHGRAQVDKEFYVSPFLSVEGHYDVWLRLDATRVAVDVNLRQDGRPMLSARFVGRVRRPTRSALARAALRTPLMMH